MAKTEIESCLLPHVVTIVPGAPKPLMLQEARNIIIEFFRRTEGWTIEADTIGLIEDVVDYDLDYDTTHVDIACTRVETIKDGTCKYKDSLMTAGEDYSLFDGDDGPMIKLAVEPSEDEADGLTMDLVIVPSPCAVYIPTHFFNRWYECWAAGTAMKLLSMPSKAFYNPQLAGYYKGEYRRLLADAIFFYSNQGVGAETDAQGESWLL